MIGEVTVANTGTISGYIDVTGYTHIGVIIPVLTAATVFFRVSDKADGTYVRLQKEDLSGDLTTASISTTSVAVIIGMPFPYRFLQVETSASQGAARTFKIFGKR